MENLFLRVLDLSITASWVILAVLAVRVLLRKAPKVYSYALWAVVGFRLVSSVSIRSLLSLFNLRPFRKITQTTGELQFIPQDIGTVEIPHIDTGIPVVDTVVNDYLPAATPEASVNPMQIVILAGMIIWIIGMIVMAAISIISYVRLRRELRFAVRKEGSIWQCETVRSPFLVGIGNPRIYLPYGLDDQTESYIMAHEQYHLRRFDHIVKLLAYTLLTIHWFNPLCHLAFRLMNRDMEMSCDEHVLNRNNIPTTQYSLSLLTIATNRRYPAATPLAFAETGVKERMINVLNWKKPKKWVTAVAILVCAIVLISCATNPKVSEPKVDDPTLLEFPGIKWGATPEEVKTALNLKEDQVISMQEEHGAPCLTAKDLTLFGYPLKGAKFYFSSSEDGPYANGLSSITAYFAEETDMTQVRDAMIQIYGDGDTWSGLNYQIRPDGELGDYIEAAKNPHRLQHYWRVSGKIGTIVEDMESVIACFETIYPKATRETIEEYLNLVHIAGIGLTDAAATEGPLVDSTVATKNVVQFNGSGVMWYMENFGK